MKTTFTYSEFKKLSPLLFTEDGRLHNFVLNIDAISAFPDIVIYVTNMDSLNALIELRRG